MGYGAAMIAPLGQQPAELAVQMRIIRLRREQSQQGALDGIRVGRLPGKVQLQAMHRPRIRPQRDRARAGFHRLGRPAALLQAPRLQEPAFRIQRIGSQAAGHRLAGLLGRAGGQHGFDRGTGRGRRWRQVVHWRRRAGCARSVSRASGVTKESRWSPTSWSTKRSILSGETS